MLWMQWGSERCLHFDGKLILTTLQSILMFIKPKTHLIPPIQRTNGIEPFYLYRNNYYLLKGGEGVLFKKNFIILSSLPNTLWFEFFIWNFLSSLSNATFVHWVQSEANVSKVLLVIPRETVSSCTNSIRLYTIIL